MPPRKKQGANPGSPDFDAQAFLDSADIAKKVVEYGPLAVIFAQGDPADSVMYIQKGGVKISVLSRYGMDDLPQGVLPHLSQETLAEMIGTTRSRVNFFMNKFRKLGFIEYNGGLKINAALLSVVLHE